MGLTQSTRYALTDFEALPSAALAVTIPYRGVLRLRAMGVKIAVIGGGIGGLTAAIALARQGMTVEVYEQAPELKEVGAGVGLWPNAMAAFEQIGLADLVAKLAVQVDRQGLMRPDGSWLLCLPAELMTQRWGAGFVTVTAIVPGSSFARAISSQNS